MYVCVCIHVYVYVTFKGAQFPNFSHNCRETSHGTIPTSCQSICQFSKTLDNYCRNCSRLKTSMVINPIS